MIQYKNIIYFNNFTFIAEQEEFISQNIFILGASRCGKSTLTDKLLDIYKNYEPLRVDSAVIALNALNLKKYMFSKNEILNLSNIKTTHEDIIYFLKNYFNQLKLDLSKTNKKLIIDTHELDVIDVIKNFKSDCDIYCLGMPNQSIKNLLRKIRKTESKLDWSYYVSNDMMKINCDEIICKSKMLHKECKELGFYFFDMSGNRKDKIMNAIKIIEKNSIQY